MRVTFLFSLTEQPFPKANMVEACQGFSFGVTAMKCFPEVRTLHLFAARYIGVYVEDLSAHPCVWSIPIECGNRTRLPPVRGALVSLLSLLGFLVHTGEPLLTSRRYGQKQEELTGLAKYSSVWS